MDEGSVGLLPSAISSESENPSPSLSAKTGLVPYPLTSCPSSNPSSSKSAIRGFKSRVYSARLLNPSTSKSRAESFCVESNP